MTYCPYCAPDEPCALHLSPRRETMTLYLTHGDLYKPGSRYMSHYCGLPVLADSEADALERTNRVLAQYHGHALAARPTGRMPILDLADEFVIGLAHELTAGGNQ